MSADDGAYCCEVLRLAEGETEDTLDERLEHKAQLAGVDVAKHPDAELPNSFSGSHSIWTSTSNADSRPTSMRSRTSALTDLTSLSSTTEVPALQALLAKTRVSPDQPFSIADYDRYASEALKPALPPSLPPPPSGRGYASIRLGIKNQMRLIREGPPKNVISCFVCSNEDGKKITFYTLPCSHSYCPSCLEVLIARTIQDASKMPPKCCGQAVPGDVVRAVLGQQQQMAFLETTQQWIAQKEFDDYARKASSDTGIGSSKHHHGDGGAEVFDSAVERDGRHTTETTAVTNRTLAEQRTKQSRALQSLRAQQILERDRFCAFERNARQAMHTRYKEAQAAIIHKYMELEPKISEQQRHALTELEDRQVVDEIELRATLAQNEQKVHVRLRHMEAYFSRSQDLNQVTRRDRTELAQQYTTRDNMERLHQSRIDIKRSQQTKKMEQMIARHKGEIEELMAKQWDEVQALSEECFKEEDAFITLSKARRERCEWRWTVMEQIERHRLEVDNAGATFAAMNPIEWPHEISERFDGFERENLARPYSPVGSTKDIEAVIRSRDSRVSRALNQPEEAMKLESQDVLNALKAILELKE